jgi:hypothetical protein
MTKEQNDGQLCIDPLTISHRRSIFIKWPCNPFKVHVNFYIPLFEGLIDVDVVDKWLNLLKGYFSSTIFSIGKRLLFHSSRSSPMLRIGGILTLSKGL